MRAHVQVAASGEGRGGAVSQGGGLRPRGRAVQLYASLICVRNVCACVNDCTHLRGACGDVALLFLCVIY